MSANSDVRLPSSFNRLAWCNLAAQSAEQIALAAAPIVAVLTLGASVGEVGLLQTALTLPFVLFAIPAGLIADRLPRRRLMAWAEALRAACLILLFALLQFGLLTWPLLSILGFITVCGTVAFSVAAPALVPALVSAQALPRANARIELARTTAFAAGPALGGILVGWTGAASAFAVAAILSMLAAMMLTGLSEPERRAVVQRNLFKETNEGAKFVFRHPLLAPVFATQFVFNIGFFLILAIFVLHAVNNLGLSAAGAGIALGMLGVGMVLGALLAPRMMRVFSFGMVIAIGPFTGLIAAIVMACSVWWPEPLLAGLSFFLFGAGPILWVVSTTTLRQTVTPGDLLGRVSAIIIMAYGARPIGSALGALIGAQVGIEACLFVAVVAFAAQALIISASPVVQLKQQPDSTHKTLKPRR